jgi:hypothetical protein
MPKLVETSYKKQTIAIGIPEFRHGFQEFRDWSTCKYFIIKNIMHL